MGDLRDKLHLVAGGAPGPPIGTCAIQVEQKPMKMDRIYVYNVWCIRQMGGFGHDMLISCLECLILIRTESCSTFCLTFDSEFRVRSSPFRHESNPYFQPRFVFPAPAYFNSLIREGFKIKRITGYDPPEVDVPSDLQKGWWVSSTWLP